MICFGDGGGNTQLWVGGSGSQKNTEEKSMKIP